MKIAVIGSGISGLSAAYYLSKKHQVDLFEREDHFGGHSYTINIQYDKKNNKNISADVGFIVFNYETYPNLISFFVSCLFATITNSLLIRSLWSIKVKYFHFKMIDKEKKAVDYLVV